LRVASGLFAGLVLSVWMLIREVSAGEPLQLTNMERQVVGWFGAAVAPVNQVSTMARNT
jgi:hypothetical protein